MVDESIDDPSQLPPPAVLAEEMTERLTAALAQAKELTVSLVARQNGEVAAEIADLSE